MGSCFCSKFDRHSVDVYYHRVKLRIVQTLVNEFTQEEFLVMATLRDLSRRVNALLFIPMLLGLSLIVRAQSSLAPISVEAFDR